MASPDYNIGPTAPVTPSPTSRALTRVTPVAPQPVTEASDFPLKRSGVNVREVFNAPDQVVVRSRTPAAALEFGLEHARGAMVKNQPADALAALDEVWSGARYTETGWYLRGGSLALLGLPGEAARISTAALSANPQSSANYFLQSLTQLALGDFDAARESLANAASHSEPGALLLIQRALLSAATGDVLQAEELVRRAAAKWPNHPALKYGRDTMRDILRMRMRDNKRTPNLSRTPVSSEALTEDAAQEIASEPSHRRDGSVSDKTAPTSDGARDVAADSLAALGQQLTRGSRARALAETRALLGALSAGGTLSGSMPAARAYAARAVLGAILDALSASPSTKGLGWDAESVDGHWQRSTPEWSQNFAARDSAIEGDEPLLSTVHVLIDALRDDRPADFAYHLRNVRGSLSNTTVQLLRAIAGSDTSLDHEAFAAHARTDHGVAYISNGTPEHFLLTPLRLGLALLPKSELQISGMRSATDPDAAVTYAASTGTVLSNGGTSDMRNVVGTAGSMVAAVSLIAAAVLAFSASLPMIAIACAGCGIWLALRRGTRAP